jgi:archaellin
MKKKMRDVLIIMAILLFMGTSFYYIVVKPVKLNIKSEVKGVFNNESPPGFQNDIEISHFTIDRTEQGLILQILFMQTPGRENLDLSQTDIKIDYGEEFRIYKFGGLYSSTESFKENQYLIVSRQSLINGSILRPFQRPTAFLLLPTEIKSFQITIISSKRVAFKTKMYNINTNTGDTIWFD